MVQSEVSISIITINYNGLDNTCALIESITFHNSLEVIVVDNASNKDEATIIQKKYPRVKVIRSSKNLGFAGGNNLGIKAASGKYLFFINNDTVFRDDGHIFALAKHLESSEKIGAVCPKIRFAWGSCPIQFAGYTPLTSITLRNRAIGFEEEDQGQHDLAHQTAYVHGAAMMVKRETIERVGLMPECYFLYYEELDWSMMITRAGYEIWYEPACTIYHKESQSTGQTSPLKIYYITRNRLLFAKRNRTGLSRVLSLVYLILFVSTKDCMKFMINKRSDLVKATIRGISDYLKL